MRVVTGSSKGRQLKAPAGSAVRPTSALVKESVFSVVQFEVEGARALDLFAGSGQMGIEALSRGAGSCVFVDNAKESIAALRGNLSSAGLFKNAEVIQSDAVLFLRGYRGKPFDIVFADPPYTSGLLEKVLPLLAGHLSVSAAVFCETGPGARLPAEAWGLSLKKQYRYGKTAVSLYRRQESEQLT